MISWSYEVKTEPVPLVEPEGGVRHEEKRDSGGGFSLRATPTSGRCNFLDGSGSEPYKAVPIRAGSPARGRKKRKGRKK